MVKLIFWELWSTVAYRNTHILFIVLCIGLHTLLSSMTGNFLQDIKTVHTKDIAAWHVCQNVVQEQWLKLRQSFDREIHWYVQPFTPSWLLPLGNVWSIGEHLPLLYFWCVPQCVYIAFFSPTLVQNWRCICWWQSSLRLPVQRGEWMHDKGGNKN